MFGSPPFPQQNNQNHLSTTSPYADLTPLLTPTGDLVTNVFIFSAASAPSAGIDLPGVFSDQLKLERMALSTPGESHKKRSIHG